MSIVDILLVVFAFLMAFAGWRSGFVRSAGSLLALIASIAVSFYAMQWLHDSYGLTFSDHPWVTIVVFCIVALIASRVAGYIVDALDLVRKVVAIIPFVNLVNSILGAVFGLAQTVVAILVLAYIAVTLIPVGDLRTSILSSVAIGRAVDFESSAGLL